MRWAASTPAAVLDVGCGTGRSIEIFRSLAPAGSWVGVDIEDSAEVRARTRDDAEFHTFDGETLPFEDGRFDVVYCAQVLEHARRPEPLLADIARVLAPGGRLAGSTSQMEPFHSRSVFGYTPYGLALLLEEAGFESLELRPSIDALTLIVRRGLSRPDHLRPLVGPRVAAQPGDRPVARPCAPARSSRDQRGEAPVLRPVLVSRDRARPL